MFEREFAASLSQRRVVVCGCKLRPYSIGHDLTLLSEGNKVTGGGESFESLPMEKQLSFVARAAIACSMTWRQYRFTPYRRLRTWIWTIQTPEITLEDVKAFALYRTLGTLEPLTQLPSDSQGRELGSPFHAILIDHLVNRLRLTLAEAMDYPIGAAKFLYFTQAESLGSVEVVNSQEMDFHNYCAEQDAIAEAEREIDKTKEIWEKH